MEDVLSFASENGIRNPEKIIRQVAEAVMNFRTLAQQNGVKQQWIGRIEECLYSHLSEWGMEGRINPIFWTTDTGLHISNVYLEQAYKGNIHLHATVNATKRRWIIRRTLPEYSSITAMGIRNVSADLLKQLVEQRISQPLAESIRH